jgi:hypothetical protein
MSLPVFLLFISVLKEDKFSYPVKQLPIKTKFLYIYDVPRKFTEDLLSEDNFELVPGTKYSQWQSEYYLHQILRESAYITEKPEQATMFFVPMYGSGMRALSPSARLGLWDELVGWLINQKTGSALSFFERNSGFDHVFTFGASRSWCKVSSPYQKTPKCLGLSHKSLFESNFVKLTVEFTGFRREHLTETSSREKLKRIIVIPYMQYDVRFALGREFYQNKLLPPPVGKRENLLYFSGSLLPKTAPFRSIFKEVCDSFEGCTFGKSSRRSFNSTHMLASLHHSTFCAILGGDTRASKRFFDAVSSLCIPIIFDPLLVLPFLDSVPYEKFVIQAPFIRSKVIVQEVLHKLKGVQQWQIEEMQVAMYSHRHKLSYLTKKSPNAVEMIIERLHDKGEAIKSLTNNKLVEKNDRDWKHMEKNLCGEFPITSCKVYTQNIQ